MSDNIIPLNNRRQDLAAGLALDRLVGQQVRKIRDRKDIEEDVAAARLQMSLQDYRSCEQGDLRFTSAHLYHLSIMFKEPLSEFYSDLPFEEDDGEFLPEISREFIDSMGRNSDRVDRLYRMIRAFLKLRDPALQESVIADTETLALLRRLAATADTEKGPPDQAG